MTRPTPSRAARYTVQGLLAIGAVTLGIWGISMNIGNDAQAQSEGADGGSAAVEPLDPVVYSHARAVQKAAALSADDLAALDLSQSQAEAVLGRLATWCESNKQRLVDTESAIFAAERDLTLYHRQKRTGQATQQELASYTDKTLALKSAIEARQALMLEGGADAIGAVPGKTAAWQHASSHARNLPVELRHITSIDKNRFVQLDATAKQQGIKLEAAMSFQEKQALDAVRQRIKSKKQTMLAAEQAALPDPDDQAEVLE